MYIIDTIIQEKPDYIIYNIDYDNVAYCRFGDYQGNIICWVKGYINNKSGIVDKNKYLELENQYEILKTEYKNIIRCKKLKNILDDNY